MGSTAFGRYFAGFCVFWPNYCVCFNWKSTKKSSPNNSKTNKKYWHSNSGDRSENLYATDIDR